MLNWIRDYVDQHRAVLASLPPEKIQRLIDLILAAWREDRQIFVFGNGGSAANLSHFATDLGKGASDKLGKRLRILSLNENVAWMTAIGNDYAYEDIFWRQLENYARPGDLVFTMSVSGSSPNLVKAVEWSKAHGVATIALIGAARGRLAALAQEVVVIESTHYGRVEDAALMLCHIIAYYLMEQAPALATVHPKART